MWNMILYKVVNCEWLVSLLCVCVFVCLCGTRRRLAIPKGVCFISPVKDASRECVQRLVSDQQHAALLTDNREALHGSSPGGVIKQEGKTRCQTGGKSPRKRRNLSSRYNS